MHFHSKLLATWPTFHACFCMCCSPAYTTTTSRQAFCYHHTLPALWPRILQGAWRAWAQAAAKNWPPNANQGRGGPSTVKIQQTDVLRVRSAGPLGQCYPQLSFAACPLLTHVPGCSLSGVLAPKLSTSPQLEFSLSQMSLTGPWPAPFLDSQLCSNLFRPGQR